ncbi:PiggyBac transposable element-derived protein 4 [Elysia marginata]|uniref:PiggyBac transposable element-derived protein 4 n=1 Tax=Elysia marginata TaxID=1093978 RepID=A0AAV4HWA9_9GAST|nr:PiggyBac transposable element-derived protein 4 [Elysia marginata]
MLKAVHTLMIDPLQLKQMLNLLSRSCKSESDADYSDQSGSESDQGASPQPGPSTSTDETPLLGPSKAKKEENRCYRGMETARAVLHWNCSKKSGRLSTRAQESRCWISDNKNMLVCACQDKKASKQVVIVSTRGKKRNITQNSKQKPSIIADYNMRMNGCGGVYQMVDYYGICYRKSSKWWKKLFLWVLEIKCPNAHTHGLFVLTRPAGTKPWDLSLRNFKLSLIEQLTAAAAEITPHAMQPQKQHRGRPQSNPIQILEGVRHKIAYTSDDRRCMVCSTPGDEKRTNFICEGCDDHPHLHQKHCFKIWPIFDMSFHPSRNFLATTSGQRHFQDFGKIDSSDSDDDKSEGEDPTTKDFSVRVWKIPLAQESAG